MLPQAISDLRSGKPILIYDDDGRERETDIMVASQFVSPEYIRMMRKDGGGLICVSVKEEDASKIGLPYLEDLLTSTGVMNGLFRNSDLGYDTSSAFSFSVNLRQNFTGISDFERSATISALSRFIAEIDRYNGTATKKFSELFRSPGHVFVLLARSGYFQKRRGHTELGTYLAELAGLIPSITMVEMLSDTGRSMTREEAYSYAEAHSLSFIEGKAIIRQWANEKGHGDGGL